MRRVAIVSLVIPMAMQAYSYKGLNAYKKLCKQCHGPAFKGAAMMYSDEWKKLFANGAQKLKALHANDKKAMQKLNSNYFQRRSTYLKHFLMKNARDMGVIPSCNALNCG